MTKIWVITKEQEEDITDPKLCSMMELMNNTKTTTTLMHGFRDHTKTDTFCLHLNNINREPGITYYVNAVDLENE